MKEGTEAIESSSSDIFALSQRRVRIAPSVLAADFARLNADLEVVEKAGAEVLHLDVMDGHFVPNISFGVPVIRSIRARTSRFLDTHLMIAEPQRYAESFVEAGSDLLSFHIEAVDRPREVIGHIRGLGAAVGVAMNPTTQVSAVESILEEVDLVLVMSVWPGFGGQAFISDVLTKVSELRERLDDTQRLEIDGGIDATTIRSAASAGVDLFVAGTAIFGKADAAAAYEALLDVAISATG